MTKFFPVSTTMNAAELVHLFYNEIELKFGAPKGIVSDRGLVFTSTFWGELAHFCYGHAKLFAKSAVFINI